MIQAIEFFIGVIILGLLVVILNPSHILMPESVHMMVLVGFIVAFVSFIGVIWKEKSIDERDYAHIQRSGRLSYFVGMAILALGTAVEIGKHEVDPWLLYALLGMVFAKLASRMYDTFRH